MTVPTPFLYEGMPIVDALLQSVVADPMKMAAVLLGEPYCTTGTVQEWTAPQLTSGIKCFLPHLVGQNSGYCKGGWEISIVFGRNGLEEASGVICSSASPLALNKPP